MKKFLLFAGLIMVGIGTANAAVRDASSIARQSSAKSTKTATRSDARTATSRTGTVSTRAPSAQQRSTTTRQTNNARTARATTSVPTARTAINTKSSRSTRLATTNDAASTISRAARTSARATTTQVASNTFGTGYNTCRDAYFTCMDQFCANQNESYRRCVCSSRLSDIQSRERQLTQTSDQLQDFKNLNIEVIPKTGAEVKAMLNATDGERIATTKHDNSESAKQLAGISEVLSKTKSKALSTQGTLDIAGNINAIWATTDLASGVQIANLTGEALYNAVRSQCVDLIADKCPDTATLNMVASAYAMYIENDCAALSSALDKKYVTANAAIRQTETQMHEARLDNYNAHNSTTINDCIAQVRKDITADMACGANYVHCLDVSGRYLNRDTGEPIYTADFYQLETSISLSGDILNNQSNRMIVNELNRKRTFAERGLETCRDLSDEVWDEFMRQAITEIYQGQQERIRQVKNECLDVVNQCYDMQSQSLKDFSNVKEQLLLGSRLELSEEMCQEKLYACANLYGGGTNGMNELLNAMSTITDQQIAQQCQNTLKDYVKEMCAVTSNDSLHSYPFGCRTYSPGSLYCAAASQNYYYNADDYTGETASPKLLAPAPSTGFLTPGTSIYASCNIGHYLAKSSTNTKFDKAPHEGNACLPCSQYGRPNCVCPGDTSAPICATSSECNDYEGSLYQKLVRYAQQTCVRPSQSNEPLPNNILQDINVVMDSIRVDMSRELARECERLGGIWIDTPHDDDASESDTETEPGTRGDGDSAETIFDKKTHATHKKFYVETSASTKWGYCASTEDEEAISPAEEGCQRSGGSWNETTCACPDPKIWNETTYQCEDAPSET